MQTAAASTPGSVPRVVLGSGSRYRRQLLARLLPAFEVAVPEVDETALSGESGPALASRLARLKAAAVARSWPAAVVIGSDQVAACAGRILGKPGSAARAAEQLGHCSGQPLLLHTAVAVQGPDGRCLEHLDRTTLQFRTLDRDEILRYVERDNPVDCAGAFRFESLGVALFSKVDTHDPTAIEGLPLVWLATALRGFGVAII
ncbi:7-methyl-GTP pyrophosphatase [Gammaproteobacteria bacterium]|nr:septum formation protein Maf [Gammaproteobacteria bacterium]CAG0943010.1 7-methyl-GTP pyrophosphatase [Gammaproteobacteria bacterium]